MHMFEDLKEMLEAEIKNIVKQDSMTPQNLEGAGKAIDILKDIETIEAMRGSHQYSNNSYNSYRMYDDGMSYAQRRDSRGRYSSRMYSRHTEMERMIDKLETMYDMATDPAVKQAIEQCINNLEG